MKTPIWQDPVIAEMRAIKEQLAAEFDFDIKAMLRDQMRREKRHGARLVSLAPKSAPKPKTKSVASRKRLAPVAAAA